MKSHQPMMRPAPATPDMRARTEPDPAEWWTQVLKEFKRSVSDLTSLIEDKSHRVDEYQVQTLSPESITQITLQPDYEMYPEIIETVIVTGPTTGAATFTLKLGKRVWNLQMPTSGIMVIAPIKISLDRSSDRYLTTTVAGNWSLELTGHADIGYRYK